MKKSLVYSLFFVALIIPICSFATNDYAATWRNQNWLFNIDDNGRVTMNSDTYGYSGGSTSDFVASLDSRGRSAFVGRYHLVNNRGHVVNGSMELFFAPFYNNTLFAEYTPDGQVATYVMSFNRISNPVAQALPPTGSPVAVAFPAIFGARTRDYYGTYSNPNWVFALDERGNITRFRSPYRRGSGWEGYSIRAFILTQDSDGNYYMTGRYRLIYYRSGRGFQETVNGTMNISFCDPSSRFQLCIEYKPDSDNNWYEMTLLRAS